MKHPIGSILIEGGCMTSAIFPYPAMTSAILPYPAMTSASIPCDEDIEEVPE